MLSPHLIRDIATRLEQQRALETTISGKHPKLTWKLRVTRDATSRLVRVFIENTVTAFVDAGDIRQRLSHLIDVLHESSATILYEGRPSTVVAEGSFVPEELTEKLRWAKNNVVFRCAELPIEGYVRRRYQIYEGEVTGKLGVREISTKNLAEVRSIIESACALPKYPYRLESGAQGEATVTEIPRLFDGTLNWNGAIVRTNPYGEIGIWRQGVHLIHTMPAGVNMPLDIFLWHTYTPARPIDD